MKGNILIVDDDQVVGNILERFLSTDYAVTRAIDGREALALFQNEPPFDLLLVDLKMPRMGGHELLKEVLKIDPDVPIIISTGYGSMDVVIEALRGGAYDFLTKPVEYSLVRQAVERGVKHYQLVLENRRYVQEIERFNEELEGRVAERTKQLAGINQIHQYIVTHVFDVRTVLTFIIGVISEVLNLERCVVYLVADQDRWIPRVGLNRTTALSDAELALLPPLSSADVSNVLGSNGVFIGENEGCIQAEPASDQDSMSPQELEVLNNFSAPIRLALKFARIYENLPTAKEGMDVDAILAEVEAYEQRKESKLSDLSGLRNV